MSADPDPVTELRRRLRLAEAETTAWRRRCERLGRALTATRALLGVADEELVEVRAAVAEAMAIGEETR